MVEIPRPGREKVRGGGKPRDADVDTVLRKGAELLQVTFIGKVFACEFLAFPHRGGIVHCLSHPFVQLFAGQFALLWYVFLCRSNLEGAVQGLQESRIEFQVRLCSCRLRAVGLSPQTLTQYQTNHYDRRSSHFAPQSYGNFSGKAPFCPSPLSLFNRLQPQTVRFSKNETKNLVH